MVELPYQIILRIQRKFKKIWTDLSNIPLQKRYIKSVSIKLKIYKEEETLKVFRLIPHEMRKV